MKYDKIVIQEKISARNFVKYNRILELDSGYLEEFIKSIKDITKKNFKKRTQNGKTIQKINSK